MSAPEPITLEDLPLDLLNEIDRRCQRFEEAWRAGHAPVVEEYLADLDGVGRRPLIRELLGLELLHRRQRGEVPVRQDYLRRFSTDGDLVDVVWDEVDTSPGVGARTTTPNDSSPTTWPKVSGYEIERLLGRGGMGVVYLARHLRLNRLVALKMVASGPQGDLGHTARFQREAEALAQVQHPNILQIFEVGESNGLPFLALEFADGGSLAERLNGTPFSPREAAWLVETLARAVHAAHQCHIIHRDLKPANILLSHCDFSVRESHKQPIVQSPLSQFVLKISDFGLARLIETDDRQTQTGALVGSPRYMAPEQAVTGADIGPATDVHALGVLLYELLTGRPPYHAATVLDTLEQIRSLEPIAPRRLQPRLPADLETVCLKCLEKEPARRYPSALALADDLRHFQAGEPVRALPVGLFGRSWRWCRRKPALAAFWATASLALVATVVASVVFAVNENRHAYDLGVALKKSEEHQTRAERRLTEIHFDQAVSKCEDGDVSGGLLWMVYCLEIAPKGSGDLTRVIRANLDGWAGRLNTLRAALVLSDASSTAEYSPNGKVVLTTTKNGVAQLWDAVTGTPIGSPFAHQGPTRALYNPDSGSVLTIDDGSGHLWDAATAEQRAELAHPGGIVAAAFGPDGRMILTCGMDQSARLWFADTGKPAGEPLSHPAPISAVEFSTDGKMALIRGGTAVQLWAISNSNHQPITLSHQGPINAAALSPDGQMLLTGSADGVAQCWDVTSGTPLGDALPHKGSVTLARFSPDGNVFLTGCGNPWTGCQLWNASTRQPVGAPLELPRGITAVAFSPDSKFLITGGNDHTARMWDIATARPRGLPLSHRHNVEVVAVSPDSSSVLTGSVDGVVRLWASTSGKLRATVVEVGNVRELAFRPAGDSLLIRDRSNIIRLYDIPVEKVPSPPLPHMTELSRAEFSPDGSRLVTLSNNNSSHFRIWEAPSGKPLTDPIPVTTRLNRVVFSPDGRLVATACSVDTVDNQGRPRKKGEARLWEAASGRMVGQVLEHPDSVKVVAFSPDGKALLTGCSDHFARRWDVSTGKLMGKALPHPESISVAAWSHDGTAFVTGCSDLCIRAWDVATEQPLSQAQLHLSSFNDVAVCTGRRLVLTGNDDGTARLWDFSGGQAPGPPLRHQGWVLGVAFSPDGRIAWTGSEDATARLWDVATSKPLGPPFPHEGNVYDASFRQDGRSLLTANRDRSRTQFHVHTWRVPQPIDGDLEQILLWVQIITGRELDAGGTARNLDLEELNQRRERLRALGGPPATAGQ